MMAPENSQATGRVVEMQVSGLVGPALDWAVAQVDGVKTIMLSVKSQPAKKPFAMFGSLALPVGADEEGYSPSSCWHCGGPLIEAHQVSLHCPQTTDDVWAAWIITNKGEVVQAGDTALIAACRAIVSAHLGEVVSVPAELT
jgi:hypothetical protein